MLPLAPPCQHTYIHLETVRYNNPVGYNTHFVRIDRFYCTKCLHKEDVKHESYHRDTPDWYKVSEDSGDGFSPVS